MTRICRAKLLRNIYNCVSYKWIIFQAFAHSDLRLASGLLVRKIKPAGGAKILSKSIAFIFALISFGKSRIHVFSPHLWVKVHILNLCWRVSHAFEFSSMNSYRHGKRNRRAGFKFRPNLLCLLSPKWPWRRQEFCLQLRTKSRRKLSFQASYLEEKNCRKSNEKPWSFPRSLGSPMIIKKVESLESCDRLHHEIGMLFNFVFN